MKLSKLIEDLTTLYKCAKQESNNDPDVFVADGTLDEMKVKGVTLNGNHSKVAIWFKVNLIKVNQ